MMSNIEWKKYVERLAEEKEGRQKEKQCLGKCGLILPIDQFGFNKAGDRRWGSCLKCREYTTSNVKAMATERSEARKIAGELRACLGVEANKMCEKTFRALSKYNRLCGSCIRAARDD